MNRYYHLGVQKNHTLYLFFIFSLLCSPYIADLIKKLELHIMVVSILLKIKCGQAQICVPKLVYWCQKQPVPNPVSVSLAYIYISDYGDSVMPFSGLVKVSFLKVFVFLRAGSMECCVCRFWLASSKAIVPALGNCILPTVNKFHIT